MNSLQSIDESLMFLRRAYVRGVALPQEQRRQLLKICLAYLCKDASTRAARDKLLHGMAHAYGLLPQPAAQPPADATDAVAAPASAGFDWEALLEPILQRYYGASLPEDRDYAELLQDMAQELDMQLRQVCQIGETTNVSWRDMLQMSKVGQETMDMAMQQAAKESFDRLLSALNPEGAKKQTERKKWHITPLYKSELYDSMVEKYGQLRAYHEKGRMLRDFRSLFRMYYKDNVKNSESS